MEYRNGKYKTTLMSSTMKIMAEIIWIEKGIVTHHPFLLLKGSYLVPLPFHHTSDSPFSQFLDGSEIGPYLRVEYIVIKYTNIIYIQGYLLR